MALVPNSGGDVFSFSDGTRAFTGYLPLDSLEPVLYNLDGPQLPRLTGYTATLLSSNPACAYQTVDGRIAGTVGELASTWDTNLALTILVQGIVPQDRARALGRLPLGGFEFAGSSEVDRGTSHAAYWSSTSSSVLDVHPPTVEGADLIASEVLALHRTGLFDFALVGVGVNREQTWQERALRWDYNLFGSRVTDLHRLLEQSYPDTYTSRATAVSGEVTVGYSTNTFAAPRAVIWRGGVAVQCRGPEGTNLLTSLANDVAGGLVVGYAADDSFRDTSLVRATVWATNGVWLADLQPSGFASSEATASNGRWIVGVGRDVTGRERALLWTSTNAASALDITPLTFNWGGTPRPTSIDTAGNITVCAGGGAAQRAWLLRVSTPAGVMGKIALSSNPSGTHTISWDASAGRVYQLEFAESLANGAWAPLDQPLRARGQTEAYEDPAINRPRRFYRVRELP